MLYRLLILLIFYATFSTNKLSGQDSAFAIVNTKIYTSPKDDPIERGTALIQGRNIVAVGPSNEISIPSNYKLINGEGKVLVYGYWNSHIHLMEEKWLQTDSLSDQVISQQFSELLISHGFTHAIDLAALDIGNLTSLRKRIENGTVDGPTLLIAGVPFVPPNASPFYIKPYVLPDVHNKKEVKTHIENQISSGADLIKLWSASPTGSEIIPMPKHLIRTAARQTKRQNCLLAAHPTHLHGAALAIKGGVNILVHTAPEDRKPWPKKLLRTAIRKNVALIPTLQLCKWDIDQHGGDGNTDSLVLTAVNQLRQYYAAGGTILFGTDLGYMTNYDPTDEWKLMQKAGLSYRDILSSMTTNPSKLFGYEHTYGKIKNGYAADLLILNEDPKNDIAAFGNVFMTIKHGKIIYRQEK